MVQKEHVNFKMDKLTRDQLTILSLLSGKSKIEIVRGFVRQCSLLVDSGTQRLILESVASPEKKVVVTVCTKLVVSSSQEELSNLLKGEK